MEGFAQMKLLFLKIVFIAPGDESQPTNSSPRKFKLVHDHPHKIKTLMINSRINETLRPKRNPSLKFLGRKKLWLGFQILLCPWCLKCRVTKTELGISKHVFSGLWWLQEISLLINSINL